MNKQNAKDYLPLVQALADGKMIQHRYDPADVWRDMPTLSFNDDRENYRIKPEPKTVPLGPDDVPPGSVICGAGELGYPGWCLITSCSTTGIRIWRHSAPDNQQEITWMCLMDGGTAIKRPEEGWKPCSKTIEE